MIPIDENNEQPTLENSKNTPVTQAKNATKKVGKKILNSNKVKFFIKTHLPLIIGLCSGLVLVLFIVGIVLFVINMPGLILGKLQAWGAQITANISGMITGNNVSATITKEDVLELAQYMQNMGYDIQGYGLGNVKFKEEKDKKNVAQRNGKAKEVEAITPTADGREYLRTYIAVNESTYMESSHSLYGTFISGINDLMNGVEEIGVALGITEERLKPTTDKDFSTGMINIVGRESLFGPQSENFVELDRENRQMKIYSKSFKLPGLFGSSIIWRTFNGDESTKWGEVFSFDLDNWLARYGRPTELFLSLHLSTMMPDLAYEVAVNQAFNTKVDVGLEDLSVTYNVEATKGDKTIDNDDVMNYYLEYCVKYADEEQNRIYKEKLKKADYNERKKMFEEFMNSQGAAVIFLINSVNSNEKIPGTDWTYQEIIELAAIVHKGGDVSSDTSTEQSESDSVDAKWPVVLGVKNHWYYNDIDFSKKVYRFANKATKTIDIASDDQNSAISKGNVDVKLNATLTSPYGVIYQVAEPEATGPNNNIIKVFKDNKYYRYDGSVERARKIENARAVESDKPNYEFNGTKYLADAEEAKEIEKENVSFEENRIESLSAFGILKNVHTEASDYIYRNLKELMINLNYFSKEELMEDVEDILLWPFATDNQNTKWETGKDAKEFGTVIKAKEDWKTVTCPMDAKVESIDGETITLEFTVLNDDAAELLEYIHKSKDPLKKLNKEAVVGMKFTIKGIRLRDNIKVGDTLKRGAELGRAIGETDGKTSITITMFELDGSIVEDLSRYLRQENNTQYEEIMRAKKEAKDTYKEGIDDIMPFFNGVRNNRNNGIPRDLRIVTDTTISREEYIKKCKAYSSAEFSQYAGEIYDVCVREGVNAVICAAQGWMEQSWGPPNTYPPKFNYWGLGVYNNMQESSYEDLPLDEYTKAYCENIKDRLQGEVGNVEMSKKLQKYDSRFTGGINNIYDVFSNYACVDDAWNNPEAQAKHAGNYVDLVISISKEIFGDDIFAKYENDSAEGAPESVKAFVDRAKSVIGSNYSPSGYYWTGDTATSAFTCSGLVDFAGNQPSQASCPESEMEVLKAHNKLVTDVNKLKYGDVVYFGFGGRHPGHVGIYLGDGQVLEADGSSVAINGGMGVQGGEFICGGCPFEGTEYLLTQEACSPYTDSFGSWLEP